MQAIMFHTSLLVTSVPEIPDIASLGERLTNILLQEQLEYHQNNNHRKNRILQGFPNLLRCTEESLILQMSRERPSTEDALNEYRHELEQFNERCQQHRTETGRVSNVWLACYYKMAMIYDLIADGLGVDPLPGNRSRITSLVKALQASDEEAWTSFPTLRLWMYVLALYYTSQMGTHAVLTL